MIEPTVNLLDREAPPGYSTEWTAHVAAEKKAAEPGIKSVIIFRIDKEWLAVPTDILQEVIDNYTIRTLPDHRGGIVKGLINVRGELLLCIALEVVLGMENAEVRTPKDRLLIFGRGAVCGASERGVRSTPISPKTVTAHARDAAQGFVRFVYRRYSALAGQGGRLSR